MGKRNIMEWEERIERYEIAVEKFEAKTGLKEGAHVRYIGTTDTQVKSIYYNYSDPRGVLDFETIYEIECMVVFRSYSIVKLVGFKKERFNNVIFEPTNKDEEKKCLKEGGSVRYIGGCANDILDSETIYKVERIERHLYGLGTTAVKLVGFENMFDRRLFEKVIEQTRRIQGS